MDEPPPLIEPLSAPAQASDLVRIGQERPLRMIAVTGGPIGSAGPKPPARLSAVAAYDAPVAFDWRSAPLAGAGRPRS